MENIKILYEDKEIIVCVKPVGMPSQAERSSSADMVSWLKNHTVSEGKPPYIGVVHRLDRPVGGIMVYAKNQKAAAVLSQQFSKHSTGKTYLAVLTGKLPKKEGVLENYLEKDGSKNISSVVASGGKLAKLEYRVLEEKEGRSLVEVRLHTGRHHQIRVQMVHAGAGIYGDMRYNRQATESWNQKQGITLNREMPALFSVGLSFEHPVTKQKMNFKVLPEKGPVSIDEWTSLSYYK